MKHCKERWKNHLNPDIQKGQWSSQEDAELLTLYLEHKNRWTLIARGMKSRNENSVKNRISSLLHKEVKMFGACSKEEAAERVISRLARDLK